MNTIDFIRETAKFLAEERPDIYTVPTAINDITEVMNHLRESDEDFTAVSFLSFMMVRIVHESGVEEYVLTQKITGLLLDLKENGALPFSYSHRVPALPRLEEDRLDDTDDQW